MKVTIVRNGNKEYYVEYSINNITNYCDIVGMIQGSIYLVDIVIISTHQSLLDAPKGW